MLPQKFHGFLHGSSMKNRGKDPGMAQCVPCAPGTANPLTGMTACIPCLVGPGMGFQMVSLRENVDVDVGGCWMVLMLMLLSDVG